MNFKPGQRVRVVRCRAASSGSKDIGKEATVVLIRTIFFQGNWFDCEILIDGDADTGYAQFGCLEPLDKPKPLAMTHEEVRELGAGLLSEIVKPGEIVEHGDVESARA